MHHICHLIIMFCSSEFLHIATGIRIPLDANSSQPTVNVTIIIH